MSVEKKDLTRIEDLGEFLHQLDEPDNYLPDLPEEAALDSLPDLPIEEPQDLPDIPQTQEEEVPPFEENSDTFSSSFESSENAGDLSFGAEEPAGPENAFESQPESEPAFEASSDNDPFAFSDTAGQIDAGEESRFSGGIQEMVDETFSAPETASFEENTSFHEDSPLTSELENYERTQVEEKPEVYTPKETFQDTKSFTEHAVLTDLAAECNPPFSVIAKNIRYLEESEEIIALLKEIGFPEDMLSQFKRQIERGTLLVPRISEFAAIYLCHKLRHLKVDLTMGLSDILHPPRHTSELDRGLVSKRSLTQNQVHKFDFKTDTADAKNIILSTLTHLEGHTIEKYLGMATEHSFLESHLVENEASEVIHQSYDELAQKLKAHALENKANAVLGINYQLTPMPSDQGMGQFRYKLTCTGNLVYLFKLNTHA
jgi:uncharacterized protein YbjQ (UPF0145 family)